MNTYFESLLFLFPLSLNSFCIYCIFPLLPSLNVVNLTLYTALILFSEQRPNTPRCQDWCLQTAYSWVPSRTPPQPKEVVLSKATLPPRDITYPKSSWYRGKDSCLKSDISEGPYQLQSLSYNWLSPFLGPRHSSASPSACRFSSDSLIAASKGISSSTSYRQIISWETWPMILWRKSIMCYNSF